MPPAKPSLELLRSLTDEHVLQALICEQRLTRAEIAARTGISKPTVGESVRRLTEAGLLRDTGERTTGRGRIGSYYALAPDLGVALVVGIAPEGVVAEAMDVRGQLVAREHEEVGRPARPEQVAQALRAVAERVLADTGRARLAVVSAADPVDRASGRLVHLPDAPFLVGELSPVEVLASLLAGPVTVDNDVNWAARAERAASGPESLDDFVYLYLGEGLGCAVVADGEVRRGSGGLAGEIAHVLTRGPGGHAVAFTDVFADLRLRQHHSTALDVDRLLSAVDTDGDRADETLAALAEAVCGVISALVAVTDPQLVVVGGAWGTHPAVLQAVSDRAAELPRSVPLRPAQITTQPALSGARAEALRDLRAAISTRRQQPT
ncbi:Sugar kinase of the NBD/HSP70 family, may contain an N-terminal HTH domain [Geodermatophilus amargosae]|uniref:Sugar kinase of the NBD/HSP70 family, may contain an N-terminal HTH domain n=1 Tax=Geodermatophilus amargosae TaxID=1296565 RepID=A0A1I7BHT6_9ACTN|nr:ROK family transcriptional regulator [Geodermatophilus amargosae]SFT86722.1 Sugar kinase of the NBD/HSP70 family, may contain an N-terminal HTH domain [Geodermatophilus amargosae]